MEHLKQAGQVGGKLGVDALHLVLSDQAACSRAGLRVPRAGFIQKDPQVAPPSQAEGCGAQAHPLGARFPGGRCGAGGELLDHLVKQRPGRRKHGHHLLSVVDGPCVQHATTGERHGERLLLAAVFSFRHPPSRNHSMRQIKSPIRLTLPGGIRSRPIPHAPRGSLHRWHPHRPYGGALRSSHFRPPARTLCRSPWPGYVHYVEAVPRRGSLSLIAW